MTVKQFFKSTAFKCIAVLMSILLVCGVLLAVCWGFLEVTDEERFNRKIGAVYGGDSVTAVAQDLSGKNLKVSGATIENVWYVNEKNDYLVQASSKGNGGNVTCWITVRMEDDKKTVKGVGKVLLYSVADAAEFKDNISGDVYDKFVTDYLDGKEYSYGTEGSDEYIQTGASRTLTAICNDVNAAIAFVKAYVSGVDIEKDYSMYIDAQNTSWEISGTAVNYTIVTKTMAQGGLTYGAFTINITVSNVNGTPTVTAYEIPEGGNGSSPVYPGNDTDYKTLMSETALSGLNNKTLADIEGYLDDERPKNEGGVLHTGATNSNQTCYEAAAYALTMYEKIINGAEGGNE